ncbi:hypothetical protein M9H77_24476 [Catharanthus roseus]|uniref:Uncharacterized protein n=1 Tax=Catharanthus roseus TaxID=4058 RepID=A0ACC0B063_CATRO|nr:hypothetical protein M9H77_24476 [Catharanthus roseus]
MASLSLSFAFNPKFQDKEAAFSLASIRSNKLLAVPNNSPYRADRFVVVGCKKSDDNHESEGKKEKESGVPTRYELFRTPIAGGVKITKLALKLQKPALAVRNLMENARFGVLSSVMMISSTKNMENEGGRAHYPFGSFIPFASDSKGHPIFPLAPSDIHKGNLINDPRCSLVVHIPEWISGLVDARVTLFGNVFPLPKQNQEWAHKLYISKHHHQQQEAVAGGIDWEWDKQVYFKMFIIKDIYFIGGFGTISWVDVKEYQSLQPDKIVVDQSEHNFMKELNVIFSEPLKEMLSKDYQFMEVDDVAFISIDSKGTYIQVRQSLNFSIHRISFEQGDLVETLEEATNALWKLINKGG